MSQEQNEFIGQLKMLIASAKEKAADGLTLAELGQLSLAFVQVVMLAVSQFTIPGASKKQIVISAVGELFDALSPFLPLPWFLSPFRGIITAKLRDIVLSLTSGIIEAIYASWQDDETPEPA